GSIGDAAALAAAGNDAGVKRVAALLAGPAPNKIALVEALAAGKNQAAIPALVAMLNDPRPEHQAAAATALGQLGARDQINKLQSMLTTPNAPPYVTMAVAGALLKLDDLSGYDKLQTWMHSEIPAMRAAAAKALSSRPDANWTTTVRDLTKDGDPLVQMDAAKLLIPFDPDLARTTLARLGQDQNPTIRDMANQASATALPADLTQLKGLLRQGDPGRIPAAQRVLELTR
ncbi:MAG: HEAT repeat domain-containing protein, partial [Ardenticatenales bacterium]